MKLLTLFSIIFTLTVQSSLSQKLPVKALSLESYTRGARKAIHISKEEISFTNNLNKNSFNLEIKDWNELMTKLEGIDISTIGKLISPSMGRASDAAWHTTLSVITQEETYTSSTFDNLKSPIELEELVICIIALDKKYNKKNRLFD